MDPQRKLVKGLAFENRATQLCNDVIGTAKGRAQVNEPILIA